MRIKTRAQLELQLEESKERVKTKKNFGLSSNKLLETLTNLCNILKILRINLFNELRIILFKIYY